MLVFVWKNGKRFECSKYLGSPEVYGRKLKLFFSFLYLVFSIIRLSLWGLVVSPSLLGHRQVFYSGAVMPGSICPLESIFDPLSSFYLVWVDRRSWGQHVGNLSRLCDGWKLSPYSGRWDVNLGPPGHHAHTLTTQPLPPQHFLWRAVLGVKVQSALNHHRCSVLTVDRGSEIHNSEIPFYPQNAFLAPQKLLSLHWIFCGQSPVL